MASSIAFLRRMTFLTLLLFSVPLHAAQPPQASAPTAASVPEAQSKPASQSTSDSDASKYSQEPVVIDDLTVKVRWESDGRGTVDYSIRERIQSESAVTSEGVLPFQYDSDNQTLEIKYVRVRKPDGSVIETPLDSAQDLTSEITRNAPMYTDMHEKHVAVRGLAVGLCFWFSWMNNFLTNMLFPLSVNGFGYPITFALIVCLCCTAGLFVLLCVPETRGKSLEQIEIEFKKGGIDSQNDKIEE